MHWRTALFLGTAIAALALTSCARPMEAAKPTSPPAAVAAAEASPTPTLLIVDPGAGTGSVSQGSKMRPGYSVIVAGGSIASAEETAAVGNPSGGVAFQLKLDQTATAKWAEYSKAHVGQTVAIVVGDEVVAAPVIAAPITDGCIVISVDDRAAAQMRAALSNR